MYKTNGQYLLEESAVKQFVDGNWVTIATFFGTGKNGETGSQLALKFYKLMSNS